MHRSLLRPALMRSLPRDLSVPITDLTVHLARSHGSVRGTSAGQERAMIEINNAQRSTSNVQLKRSEKKIDFPAFALQTAMSDASRLQERDCHCR
jgi:hypothetical protein